MRKDLQLNPHHLVAKLGREASSFTKQDIINYIIAEDIKMVNFMYPAGDGRLKTLNFFINSLEYLETVLTCGERVDGSSLFPHISAGSSDLYAVPRFSTAFRDPFATIPTLAMLCSFYDKDGQPLQSTPDQTLHKACQVFREETGMVFEAMGELEFYVIRDDTSLFPATDQRGYHESAPFAKCGDFRVECMLRIAEAGGKIKYGHTEVGNFTLNGKVYEQNEIEFLPCPAESAADQLMIAKWVIRNVAMRHGVNVTFAPKITTGKAGSGLHIHMRMVRDGVNEMLSNGKMSQKARRAIAGLMELAPAITAFGNKVPTSYFRLVPHQEAPTNICWGDRNRSVLVRIPLGWSAKTDMCHSANPLEPMDERDYSIKQTMEMRSPDGSADIYELIAGLAVACRYGLSLPNADEIAERTYVNVNIHSQENSARLEALGALPENCWQSADALEKWRHVFEDKGVFSPASIDGIIRRLRAHDDRTLRLDAQINPTLVETLVAQFFHCG
ncbi:MAG: glutamine synthetase [Muribaculaceae bacterium]|nr:glutamine synthetase [Muribaculaceae bacterium]